MCPLQELTTCVQKNPFQDPASHWTSRQVDEIYINELYPDPTGTCKVRGIENK